VIFIEPFDDARNDTGDVDRDLRLPGPNEALSTKVFHTLSEELDLPQLGISGCCALRHQRLCSFA